MLKITILGSSAATPFPRTTKNQWADYSDIEHYAKKYPLHNDPICNLAKQGGKNRRTRSSIAVKSGIATILFDAGPDIKYQLKKYNIKPDAVFISHAHADARAGEEYMKQSGRPIYSEKNKNIKIGRTYKIGPLDISPFRVRHVKNIKTVGYRMTDGRRTVSIATDLSSTAGLEKIFKKSDIVLVDGSILSRNFGGHLPIESQLNIYKKWKLKKIIFTHIGHQTLPHDELIAHVKKIYPKTSVAYDGLKIIL